MRVKLNVFAMVLLLVSPLGFAIGDSQQVTNPSKHQENSNQEALSHLGLTALGIYTDFKFNSTAGTNYNLFKGYSKLASVGGNNVQLGNQWTAGLEIIAVETILNSELFIDPGLPSKTHQRIRNNTLFGYVIKQLNSNWFLNLSGAYGSNKINMSSIITLPLEQQMGTASAHSTNWFANVMGLYSKGWQHWVITANARLLYSQVNNQSYSFLFPTATNLLVAPLTNNSWYLMENLELGYQQSAWVPFVNVGLLQVLSFQNSRALTNQPINGISPQLNVDKDGFRVGAGLSYGFKQFRVRIEEQYFNAGSVFSSYQTFLSLKYVAA